MFALPIMLDSDMKGKTKVVKKYKEIKNCPCCNSEERETHSVIDESKIEITNKFPWSECLKCGFKYPKYNVTKEEKLMGLNLTFLANEALRIIGDNIEIKPSLSMLDEKGRDTTKDIILNIQCKNLSDIDMASPMEYIIKPACLVLVKEINEKYKNWGFIELRLERSGVSSRMNFEGFSIRLRENHYPDDNSYELNIDIGINPKCREFIIREFKNG